MNRPIISLCMIVRDEEPTLERCLESVAGAYDELIVVDTGSKDRTVAIAEASGARVEHFEWRDDFAAARNHACSFASGEWIFMIDGDEFLSPDGVGPRLARFLGQLPERIDKLLVEQRTVVDGEVVASMLVDRIFRNRADLRWRYRIHEVIETPGDRTAMTRDAYLLHEPAHKRRDDMRVSEEREALYLKALELDVADHPEDPRPAFYLAATLYGAGRHQDALTAYERYFALSEGKEPSRRAVAFRDAAVSAGAMGDAVRQRSLLFRSMASDWRSAETYLAVAEAALDRLDRDETCHWLTVSTLCEPSGVETAESLGARRAVLWNRVAVLHREAGDDDAARRCEDAARNGVARARPPEKTRSPARKRRSKRRR